MSSKPRYKKSKKESVVSDPTLSPPQSNDNDTDQRSDGGGGTLPVGLFLRSKRLEKSFQKEDIAAILRISYIYVNAIEEGLTHQLPERVYTLGYVRSYARLLGLDPFQIADRFTSEFFPIPSRLVSTDAAASPLSHLDQGSPKQTRRILAATSLLILVLTVAWVIYGTFQGQNTTTVSLKEMTRIDEQGNKVDDTPSILDHVAAFLSLNAAPTTKKGDLKIPIPSRKNDPRPKKAPRKKNAPLPGLAYGDGPSPIRTESLKSPTEQQTPTPQEVETKTFVGDHSRPSITLQVRSLCWVEIKDQNQKVLLSGNLKPGEKYDVPKRPGLLLSVGNAGGLWISVGGKDPAPLGHPGEVRHNIPLDHQR